MALTGVEGAMGTAALSDVSRLGAIIAEVTTFGLNGHMPVFENALRMVDLVRALTCARLYMARKLDFVTIWPVL